MSEVASCEAVDFGRWVKATTLGWLLGFVFVVALAIAWDLLGGGAQFMVGVGMGAGVGILQSRALPELIGPTGRWLVATTVGMGLPFVLWDLSTLLGFGGFFSLSVCVAVGSVLVGASQSVLLRPRMSRTLWWIPASVVGWSLPVAAIALGDSGVLSGPGTVLSVCAMFLGGAVLGAVTGTALVWMARRPAVQPAIAADRGSLGEPQR